MTKLIFLIADLFFPPPLLLKVCLRFNFTTLIKCSSIWSLAHPDSSRYTLYLTMLLMNILSPGSLSKRFLRTPGATEYGMFKVTCGGWHDLGFRYSCESAVWGKSLELNSHFSGVLLYPEKPTPANWFPS